jgi:hypothetical protein
MSYRPNKSPEIRNFDELRSWLEGELDAVSKAIEETIAVDLRPVFRPPERPRDGMIVYADGTLWNPGGGVGVYARVAGAWVKL